jgi:hypothetical protein
MGVPVMMLSLTPHTSSHRLQIKVSVTSVQFFNECAVFTPGCALQTQQKEGAAEQRDTPVRRAVEEDVHSLLERRQHEHALFELRDTEASDTQNLHAA